MPQQNTSVITAGEVGKDPEDEGGIGYAGVQFQHSQLELKATGAGLGIGRRTVPNPAAQFSMSGAQFGNGHAKSMMSDSDEEE